MRVVIALALILTALGCHEATTPTELSENRGPAGGSGMLATDRESYSPGATVTLSLHNARSHEVGYNLCSSALQRQSSGEWRTAEFENERACTRELRIAEPGSTATYGFHLDARLPEGTYRFRTSIVNMRAEGQETLTSNSFRITR